MNTHRVKTNRYDDSKPNKKVEAFNREVERNRSIATGLLHDPNYRKRQNQKWQ